MYVCECGCMHVVMDGWMEGWMDGWTETWATKIKV
jgi:hypothetical protein